MRTGLTVSRLAAAAWVGAAALFVVTAVREVTCPDFDSPTKDALVLLRFPAYYTFGFSLVAIALVGSIASVAGVARRTESSGSQDLKRERRRLQTASGLLACALLVMGIDFATVYGPLAEMITPPGRARLAEFRTYHRASVWLNMADVGLCALAAALLCWPSSDRST